MENCEKEKCGEKCHGKARQTRKTAGIAENPAPPTNTTGLTGFPLSKKLLKILGN